MIDTERITAVRNIFLEATSRSIFRKYVFDKIAKRYPYPERVTTS